MSGARWVLCVTMRSPFVVPVHLGEDFRSCKRVCWALTIFGKPLLKDKPLPDGVPPQRTTGLCETCCPLVQAGLRGASLSFRQLLPGIGQLVLNDDGLACGGINQVVLGARDRETPPLGQSLTLCQVTQIIIGQGLVHGLGVELLPGSHPIASEARRLCWLKRICDAGNDPFHTRPAARLLCFGQHRRLGSCGIWKSVLIGLDNCHLFFQCALPGFRATPDRKSSS